MSEDIETIAGEIGAARRAGGSGVPVEKLRVAGALFTVAKGVAEMTVDDRADFERACRVHGVIPPRLISATPGETVHFLRGGQALCGRMGQLTPDQWPAGNKWTAEASRITCDGCNARFSSLRATIR